MNNMMIHSSGAQHESNWTIDSDWINDFPQPIGEGGRDELTTTFDDAEFFDFDEIFKNWGPQESNDDSIIPNSDLGVVLEHDDFVDVEELFKGCEKNDNDGGRQETKKNVIIIDDDDDAEDEMGTSNNINTNTIDREEGLLMIQVDNGCPQEIIDDNRDLYNDQTTTTNILPMGYRFKPKDAELIYCLSKKVNNEPLPTDQIHDDVNLYEFDAPNLMEYFGDNGDGEWYFVTRLKMKNKGHTNRDRTTPNGCWKATSGDHDIKHGGIKVGYRKTLVFYSGKRSKTDWIMHEYRLQDDDAMVICRVHNGKREQNKSK